MVLLIPVVVEAVCVVVVGLALVAVGLALVVVSQAWIFMIKEALINMNFLCDRRGNYLISRFNELSLQYL